MAKFRCRNCENVFEHFCDGFEDSNKVQCPSCQSHWTEMTNEKKGFNPFPVLPYTDPTYPVPHIDPFPMDPNPWRVWCRTLHAPCIVNAGTTNGR